MFASRGAVLAINRIIDMGPPTMLDSYEAYGCAVNRIGVAELFQRYEEVGFLYPEKLRRLEPVMPLVKENWRKALRGGELIHWVATYDDPEAGAWAAISSWRSTDTGWVTQHLVSTGNPLASRAVMLAGQAVRIKDGLDSAHQNWFRRGNRFANKIFGSIVRTLGDDNGWVGDHCYFFLRFPLILRVPERVRVEPARSDDRAEIRALATRTRSHAYVVAEGLLDDDLELEAVDHLYRRLGLRRYRKVFVARDRKSGDLVGAALAYRGPMGFNFSFLENRCDLLLDEAMSASQRIDVCAGLSAAVFDVYDGFELRGIPIVVSKGAADSMQALGAEFVREYAQSIWLKAGFQDWYRHTERFYDRIAGAQRVHGIGSRSSAAQGFVK